jgi:hypothetical protein
MRNYQIDIGEGPPGVSRPTDQKKAFSVLKALPDLGTSVRDTIVIQSMLEAEPADAGTDEYREAIMRGSREEKAAAASEKSKRKEKRKVASPIPSEPSEQFVPSEHSDPVEDYGMDVEIEIPEPVAVPKSESKRKHGWLPPQADVESAEIDEPVAGPSQRPVSRSSSKPTRASKRNGKAVETSDAEESYHEAEYQVTSKRRPVAKKRGGSRAGRSGTDSDAGQAKRQADQSARKAKKRQRIVSSTPEFDPLREDDALYAETNYPESFERSKQWAHYDDIVGVSEDDSDDGDGEYQFEVEQDGQAKWIGLRRTAGMEVGIELESGIGWGDLVAPDVAERSRDFVQTIAHAVIATGVRMQDAAHRALSVATELANGLVDADPDDSTVEDLLP